MKDLILSLSIFISTIFFSLATIMGQSTEDTSGYHMIAAGYAVVCVLTLVLSRGSYSRKTDGSNLISILILAVILAIGFLSGATDNSYYQQYIVFGIPAALVGVYYGKRGTITPLVRWFDIYFLIIAISIFVSFPKFYASRLMGEVGYSQTLSYEASFVLLMDIFLLSDDNRTRHFGFTNTKLYRFLCLVIMPFLVLAIVLSGGRGGFITLIVGIIVYLLCNRKSKKKLFRYSFLIVIIVAILSPIVMKVLGPSVSDFASESFGRIFSYISGGKLDMSQTSGRDEILKKAFLLIDKEPLGGYGMFNYIKALGTYPHNIFVEWLLQGGVLLFTIAILINLWFFSKLRKLSKRNNDFVVFYPIIIYPLTELLFSGTWTTNPYLWFSLMFVINYRPNSIIKNEKCIVNHDNVPEQAAN